MKELEFNNRKIKFRKWKVKDKKELDKCQNDVEKRKIYLYNCLETNTVLDLEEYNYVLTQIRDYSLDTELDFEVTCECGNTQNVSFRASDIVTYKNANYKPVIIGDICIEFGNVDDSDYENIVINAQTMSERYISDLAFHIKKINGSDVQYEQCIEFIENLDVSLYEKLFEEWELQRFKCNFLHSIKCEKCGKETVYNFEDMKGFFPSSWSI